ncbi:NaCP60E [Symbiodinium sp. KB8]|nr:NaCP60E [Symbiodinium sp. KB8]
MAAGSRLNHCLMELTKQCQDVLEENRRLETEVQELGGKLREAKGGPKESLEPEVLEIDHPFAPEAVSRTTNGPRVSFDHLVCTKPAWDESTSKSPSPTKANANRVALDSGADEGPPEVETLSGLRIGMLKSPTVFPGEKAPWSMPELLQLIRGECCAAPGRGSIVQRFADGMLFRTMCVLAIGANTVYIGYVADAHLTNSYNRMMGLDHYQPAVYPDILFAVWFTLELMVRILAEKVSFFTGEDMWWNVFDVFLVLNAIIELSAPEGVIDLSLLRVFRVFRLVRVVRVVRTVKALRSLRTMLFAMLNSFSALLWAFVLIGIVMFVFSVIFDMAISYSYDSMDPSSSGDRAEVERINRYFSTLFDTMVALFCSITGGNDWWMYAELLRGIYFGEVYFVLFAFYVGLSSVGVLNVVTGIFVDSAVCTRTEDEVVESWTEDQKRTAEEVRRIFKEADRDMSGSMTYRELENHLQNPWVKAYFSGMDIDASEAAIIFTLMDSDRDNEVTIDEFVDGTMKLKGHAKSIDILSVMYDNAKFQAKFSIFCSHVEDQLVDMKNLITPGAGDKMERMYRPANQQVDYVKCFNKLRTADLGQTADPAPDDLRCDPILPTHHG